MLNGALEQKREVAVRLPGFEERKQRTAFI